MQNPKTALIAMSGGVDSSVAAALTKDAGYDCAGAAMRLIDGGKCCSLSDVEDARSAAHRLDMPFYVFDFSEDFQKSVMDHFVAAYSRGETPNPCIECNRRLKFDLLLARANKIGLNYIVTGHYARVEEDGGRFLLKKSADTAKDQSYVLYMLTQEQLSKTLFPLGGMTKTQVRQIAEERAFLNARKRDSQDICFVPDGDYGAFVEKTVPQTPGLFVDTDGNVLGRHKGIVHYTPGQRRGLGVSASERLYVRRVDAENNTVTLAKLSEMGEKTLTARDFNWIVPEPQGQIRCKARVRYHQPEQDCAAEITPDGGIRITFESPQRAFAPGQSVVLYGGEYVLGGGIINNEQ